MFWNYFKTKFERLILSKNPVKPTALGKRFAIDALLLETAAIRKERITHFKELKALANALLTENKRLKDNHKAAWEGKVVENNIKRLKEIIQRANVSLGDESLDDYAQGTSRQQLELLGQGSFFSRPDLLNHLRRVTYSSERFEVMRYSPSYSIVHDLHWINAGTVGEQNDVAFGNVSPDVFEKYCPMLVAEINAKVIPYLKHKMQYAASVKLLEEVTGNFVRNSFLVTNILLITVTEGIVREMAVFVYRKQNPSLTSEEVDKYVNDGFHSLESLVNKGDWKEDLTIGISEAYALSKYLDDPSLAKAAKKIDKHKEANENVKLKLIEMESELRANPEGEYSDQLKRKIESIVDHLKEIGNDLLNPTTDVAHVSLRTKLQFLLRRYKEDRNSIIHGQYINFDKGWKSLIYLSALLKVFEVVREYDNVYKTD